MSSTAPLTPDSLVSLALRTRLVGVLFLGQSFFSAAQILTFALMPIVATQLAGSEALAGLPATITLLGRAVAAFPVGWLMDRLGRRFGLATGFMLCTIGSIVSALAIGWISFPAFLLGTLVAGMGRGIGEQARFAAADVETADRRAKAIGWVVFAGTVGAVAGPRLLVPAEDLASRFGLHMEMGPFLLGALLFYLAFMITVVFLRPDPMLVSRALDAAEPRHVDSPPVALRTLRVIFTDWNVRLALLSMTVGQLVMTTLMVITPLYMSKLDYSIDAIAWVLTAHTLGMFGLSSLTGWLIDRTNAIAVIVVGGLILIASAILTPIAGTLFGLAVALFLLGLGWNFCFVAGSALLAAALRPGERGRVQGASETLISLASGTGSLSVGVLFATSGMTGISLGGLLFSVALILATLWIARLRPQSVPVPGD